MNRGEPVVAMYQKSTRKQKRRITTSCSVCIRRIWFDPIYIQEPEGVPVPRNSWVLCKECHGLLMTEFRRSPVRSPLRIPLLGEAIMAMVILPLQEKMMRQNAPLVSPEYVREAYAFSLAKPETRRMMLKLYRSVNPRDFVGREERLHTLTTHVPTLVLWGDKDPFITPEYAEQFGSAHVEHFPQNGHWLALESPEIVAQRLATFFAKAT
jgi:pimeloyl-ACP methyl ester carboxylesterase